MTDQVTRAATPQEIEAAKARAQLSAPPAEKEPPKFVGESARTMSIPLDFPVEYDGKVYEEVVIRRPVMREWRNYLRQCEDAVKTKGPGADDLVDQPWLSVPAVVLESLDVIDATRVESAQQGFFGRSSSSEEPGGTGEATSTPNEASTS